MCNVVTSAQNCPKKAKSSWLTKPLSTKTSPLATAVPPGVILVFLPDKEINYLKFYLFIAIVFVLVMTMMFSFSQKGAKNGYSFALGLT